MNDPTMKRQANNPPHSGSEKDTIFKRSGKTFSDRKLKRMKLLLGGDPKEVLEDLYNKQGLSISDIANRFHKTPQTIHNWFKRFDITSIPYNSAKTRRERNLDQLKQLLGGDPKEVLEDLHTKQGLSVSDIAYRFNKDPQTIYNWFERFGITRISRLGRLKHLLGGDPKEFLEDLHTKQGLSEREIARRYQMHHVTVHYWLKKFSITKLPHRSLKNGGSISSDARDLVHSAINNGSFEYLPQKKKDPAIKYQANNPPLPGSENAAIVKRKRKPLSDHELERLKQLLGGDPKQVLEDLYIKQGLSQREIAGRYHKSLTTIHIWFKMFGIRRPSRITLRLKYLLGGDPKQVLEDLYIKQGLTMADIAKRFHKSPPTVYSWLKSYEITTNPHLVRLAQLRQLLGGDPKEVLEDLYIKQGLSQREIAGRLHKDPSTVNEWFKSFGISHLAQLRQLLGGDPKEVLEDLYIKQGLSIFDIAYNYNKDPSTVSIWFKKFGITKIRYHKSHKENTKFRHNQTAKHKFLDSGYRVSRLARLRSPEFQAKGRIARAKLFKEEPDIFKRRGKTLKEHKLEQLKLLIGGEPKEVLEELHLRQGLSQQDIAQRFHKHHDTVTHWFKRFGITTNLHISTKTNRKRYADQIEKLLGGDPKQVLEDLHIRQQLPVNAIARRNNKHPVTVRGWFKKYGIVMIRYNHKMGGSINSEAQELVHSAIKNGLFEELPIRQKYLLTLRYLQTGKPLTLEEIAEKLGGISRQRVNELEKTTLNNLRVQLLNGPRLQINKTPEEERLKRGQHVKDKMKNPEYRKQVLSKLHSPEAIEKSRLARLKLYKENPDIFKRIRETKNARELARLRQLLGGDPKEILEDLYIKQGLSHKEIANRFNTSPHYVYYWFKKFGIRTLPRIVRQYRLKLKKLLGGDPKEILEDLYNNQGLSIHDIAYRYNKNPSTVIIWFKELGITHKEAKERRE